MSQVCLLIAVYNNPDTIAAVVEGCLSATDLPVIVVDDGSAAPVAGLLKPNPRIHLRRHPVNLGKGEALKNGFQFARELGFRHALTLDGDGQHFPSDMPLMLQAARFAQDEILIGARRMDGANSPFLSRLGRAFSDLWIWCITGKRVRDSQCGVRLYPLELMRGLEFSSSRYDFEMEVLVSLLWAGASSRSVEIRVDYPEQRVSHFHKLKDTLRIAFVSLRLLRLAAGLKARAKENKA